MKKHTDTPDPNVIPVKEFRTISKLSKIKRNERGFNIYIGSETDFSISVARYLESKSLNFTHVANEIKTDVKQKKNGKFYTATGNKLKAMGKKKGVPDFLIFNHSTNNAYCGLAIELKVNDNKPTPEQKDWLLVLSLIGWKTLWTNSFDEAIKVIENYLK